MSMSKYDNLRSASEGRATSCAVRCLEVQHPSIQTFTTRGAEFHTKQHIRVLYKNIRSFKLSDRRRSRSNTLEDLLEKWEVDIAVFSETWLRDEGDVRKVMYENFIAVHSCRARKGVTRGGGVSIYVRKTLNIDFKVLDGTGRVYKVNEHGHIELREENMDNLYYSLLHVRIQRNEKPLLDVMGLYNSSKKKRAGGSGIPPHNEATFLDDLAEKHLNLKLTGHSAGGYDPPCMVLGDFNINLLSSSYGKQQSRYLSLMKDHHFHLCTSLYPTRLENLIDHIWCRAGVTHRHRVTRTNTNGTASLPLLCRVSNIIVANSDGIGDHNILIGDLTLSGDDGSMTHPEPATSAAARREAIMTINSQAKSSPPVLNLQRTPSIREKPIRGSMTRLPLAPVPSNPQSTPRSRPQPSRDNRAFIPQATSTSPEPWLHSAFSSSCYNTIRREEEEEDFDDFTRNLEDYHVTLLRRGPRVRDANHHCNNDCVLQEVKKYVITADCDEGILTSDDDDEGILTSDDDDEGILTSNDDDEGILTSDDDDDEGIICGLVAAKHVENSLLLWKTLCAFAKNVLYYYGAAAGAHLFLGILMCGFLLHSQKWLLFLET